MPSLRALFPTLMGLLALTACSSAPRPADGPAWTREPSRTIDNGYIVYVGIGEDVRLERARFKAEGEAIADLANECSFAPKGARIEDHFDAESENGFHRAYAKIGIAFEECETAKRAIEPEAVRALASAPMTSQLKEYQALMHEPDPQTVTAVAATPASSGDAASQYYATRQQVVYWKQDVILAPPAVFAASAPATVVYLERVRPAMVQITQYEAAHPAWRTRVGATWSHFPGRPASLARSAPAMPRMRAIRGAPRIPGAVRGFSHPGRFPRGFGRRRGRW